LRFGVWEGDLGAERAFVGEVLVEPPVCVFVCLCVCVCVCGCGCGWGWGWVGGCGGVEPPGAKPSLLRAPVRQTRPQHCPRDSVLDTPHGTRHGGIHTTDGRDLVLETPPMDETLCWTHRPRTWKKKSLGRYPIKAGPPNHHDGNVDSDQ